MRCFVLHNVPQDKPSYNFTLSFELDNIYIHIDIDIFQCVIKSKILKVSLNGAKMKCNSVKGCMAI